MWLLLVALLLSNFASYSQASLFFPSASTYGIFAAIAVPLDLPHRNVFVSYNFEANFNLPEKWTLPKYFEGISDEQMNEEVARMNGAISTCTANCSHDSIEEEETSGNAKGRINNSAPNSTHNRKRRALPSLFTRTNFYEILKDKFQRHGYESESCLLRFICEINSSELGYVNGVLGSLMHIMFAPTTSRNEHLDQKYYKAELEGRHDDCSHYVEKCSESLLDLISTTLQDIIDNMLDFN